MRNEADHRIANNLASLAAFLRFESRRIDSVESGRKALASAAGRFKAISRVHTAATRTDRRGQADLGTHLAAVARDLSEALGIDVVTECSGLWVSAELVGGFTVILSEFAINSAKHNPDLTGLLVTLDAARLADTDLRVEIRDNGIGFPDGFDPSASTGLGMAILGSTVARFGGTMTARTDRPGANLALTFPSCTD